MEDLRVGLVEKFSVCILVGLIVLSVFGFVGPVDAASASLFLTPSSNSVDVGDTFSISVVVSSPDTLVNAAQGAIIYPSGLLQVDSISKGSFINFWAREPAFSNTSGTVNFEGVILNGWQGDSANVLTLNFRAVANGEATIRLSSGAVLAHDGLGTNIVSFLGLSSVDIGAVVPIVEPEPEVDVVGDSDDSIDSVESVVGGLPVSPIIVSDSHPNSGDWYSDNDAVFSWKIPNGVTGVNILADHNKESNIGTGSDGLFSTYTYEDVDDGEWYMHVRFLNSAGSGPVKVFKFNIDSVEPSLLVIDEVDGGDSVTRFEFKGEDELSGLDRFAVSVDGGEWADVDSVDGIGEFSPRDLVEGAHVISVRAYDKAGNFIESEHKFEVFGVVAPVIEDHSFEWNDNEPLFVSGRAVAGSSVWIYLKRQDDKALVVKVASDSNGLFYYKSDERLLEGVYMVWATSISANGVESVKSNSFPYSVRYGVFDDRFLYFAFSIPVLAFVLFLFLLWRRRKRVVCIINENGGAYGNRVNRKAVRRAVTKKGVRKTGGKKAVSDTKSSGKVLNKKAGVKFAKKGARNSGRKRAATSRKGVVKKTIGKSNTVARKSISKSVGNSKIKKSSKSNSTKNSAGTKSVGKGKSISRGKSTKFAGSGSKVVKKAVRKVNTKNVVRKKIVSKKSGVKKKISSRKTIRK